MNKFVQILINDPDHAQEILDSLAEDGRQILLNRALLYAVGIEDVEIISWLIVRGADVNYKTPEESVLGKATTFVGPQSLEALAVILASGIRKSLFPDAVWHCVDARVIVSAHEIGDDKEAQSALKMLLGAGFPVDAADAHDNTPLHEAVRYYHKHLDFCQAGDMVPILLSYGASPLARNAKGETPLDFTIRNGDAVNIGLLQRFVR